MNKMLSAGSGRAQMFCDELLFCRQKIAVPGRQRQERVECFLIWRPRGSNSTQDVRESPCSNHQGAQHSTGIELYRTGREGHRGRVAVVGDHTDPTIEEGAAVCSRDELMEEIHQENGFSLFPQKKRGPSMFFSFL